MSRKNKKDRDGGVETILEPAMPEAKTSVDESKEAEVAEAAEATDDEEWSIDDPRRPEWPEDGYVIAEGKSLSVGSRVLEPGMAVEPNDLCSDADVAAASFDRLLDRGFIVEAMPKEAE